MMFPTEILHLIIREATRVPDAFDTSFDSVERERRDALVDLIHDSMSVKTSLSLVCKTFHHITDPFLYEIIIILRFDYVPTIAKLLSAVPPGRSHPRGHTCRRLDFYLGVGAVEYHDTAWNEGGHTLWGLIPACPRLEILMCRIVRSESNPRRADLPRLTHNALWKTMAVHYPSTLRRLELYGFHIRMDHVEMLLRYFLKLEVCRIVYVCPFDEEDDVYDDEEPLERVHENRHGSRCFDQTSECFSGLFDPETSRHFAEIKQNASWPPFEGKPPYELPSLHTLLIEDFTERINEFKLPCLRRLGIYSFIHTESNALFAATRRHLSSITHLIHDGEITLAQILSLSPSLTHLTRHIIQTQFLPSSFVKPHPTLCFVRFSNGKNSKISPFIAELVSAVRSGMLPSLRTVEVTRFGWESDDELLPFADCKAVGVALEVIVNPRYRLSGRQRKHD